MKIHGYLDASIQFPIHKIFEIMKDKFVWSYLVQLRRISISDVSILYYTFVAFLLVFNIGIVKIQTFLRWYYYSLNLEIFFVWSRWKRFMKPSFVNAADRKWYLRRYPVGVRIEKSKKATLFNVTNAEQLCSYSKPCFR